jgi:hypothetical protein
MYVYHGCCVTNPIPIKKSFSGLQTLFGSIKASLSEEFISSTFRVEEQGRKRSQKKEGPAQTNGAWKIWPGIILSKLYRNCVRASGTVITVRDSE